MKIESESKGYQENMEEIQRKFRKIPEEIQRNSKVYPKNMEEIKRKFKRIPEEIPEEIQRKSKGNLIISV